MAESPVERVRAVEMTAALSLDTDLQLALDLEHGLRSTMFAVRIGEALGVDRATATSGACDSRYAPARSPTTAPIRGSSNGTERHRPSTGEDDEPGAR